MKNKSLEQRTDHSEDSMVPGDVAHGDEHSEGEVSHKKDVLPDASINKSIAANGEDETQQSDEGMLHRNEHLEGNVVIRNIWNYLMLQVIPVVR